MEIGCRIVFNELPIYAASLAPQVGQVVRGTLARIEARAKLSLSGPKHGLVYRRGRVGRRMTRSLAGAGLRTYQTRGGTLMAIVSYKFHRASAPGEPPATDTGALANSIRAEMLDATNGVVGSALVTAPILEFGGGRLAPRPWLGPAAEAERARHVAAIREALRR